MKDSLAGFQVPPRHRPTLDAVATDSTEGSVAPRSGPAPRPTTDPRTAAQMSRQARKDTTPEMLLRRELHRRGLRYRIEYPLPGMRRRRADSAFTRAKVAVFVDGCFWHACPQHATSPANNGAWWAEKLRRNVERDRETDVHLQQWGWTVIRAWEHEDPCEVAERVAREVRN
ncbi:very short patch repair endonuclease [Mobilicoccus sp.]|uniref:very short patch repair endonuclease n=1 Tax=Mobilicoccus sp. TaxID=2034349 RepID=UPI0028B26401|nr:very short patch repair endonuclease [Mobilicoccus sp.]